MINKYLNGAFYFALIQDMERRSKGKCKRDYYAKKTGYNYVCIWSIKNGNYTVMGNYHLRDKELSFKAKEFYN